MSWEKVEKYLKTAKGIAYDGCHKIYLAMDERQFQEFKECGYGKEPHSLIRVSDPVSALSQVQTWFYNSCGLRFVNAVKGEGNNEDFTTLIAQFEFDEPYDEEEDVE